MAGINWPGLLSWSTRYHDGTAPSQFKEMTEEDREFLEKAMEEAFGKIEDPNQVLAEAISQLKGSGGAEDVILTTLEVIDKCCDDPDCARNVEKLDGVQPLLDVLKSHKGPVCVRTLEILALLFANNPTIQEAGERRGAMSMILQSLQDAEATSEQQNKAFRALVALLRNFRTLEEAFLKDAGGHQILMSCLDVSRDAKMREKAVSFLSSLAHEKLLNSVDVERLVAPVAGLLQSADEESLQYRESLAACVCSLATLAESQGRQQLAEATQKRLIQLGKENDTDHAVEKSALQDTLVAVAA